MKEVVLVNMYTEDDNVCLQTMGKKMFDSLEDSTHRIICDNESPVTKISKINIAKTMHEQMYYEWKDGKFFTHRTSLPKIIRNYICIRKIFQLANPTFLHLLIDIDMKIFNFGT